MIMFMPDSAAFRYLDVEKFGLGTLTVIGLAVLISVLCIVASLRGVAPGFEEGIPSLNR